MILVIDKKFNPFNQDDYNSYIDFIKSIRFIFFDALFGSGSNVIFYGTYTRSIVTDSDTSRSVIKFQRVLDKSTGTTHILIPAQLIPYSSIPLQFQTMIINASDDDLPDLSVLFNLDPRTLLHIRSVFHAFWETLSDWFSIPLTSLPRKAFQLTGRQFMQMRGSIHLFPPT